MLIEKQIRKLARSSYWQNIYRASKESNGIILFENSSNLSGLQNLFLYWLKIYSLLYDELASKEWENLDTEVIKSDIRCDAFLAYRKRELDRKLQQYKKDSKAPTGKGKRSSKVPVKKFNVFKGATNKGDN